MDASNYPKVSVPLWCQSTHVTGTWWWHERLQSKCEAIILALHLEASCALPPSWRRPMSIAAELVSTYCSQVGPRMFANTYCSYSSCRKLTRCPTNMYGNFFRHMPSYWRKLFSWNQPIINMVNSDSDSQHCHCNKMLEVGSRWWDSALMNLRWRTMYTFL